MNRAINTTRELNNQILLGISLFKYIFKSKIYIQYSIGNEKSHYSCNTSDQTSSHTKAIPKCILIFLKLSSIQTVIFNSIMFVPVQSCCRVFTKQDIELNKLNLFSIVIFTLV